MDVRWAGLLVATGNHGMFLAGECNTQRGIKIVSLPAGSRTKALDAAISAHLYEPGALRVELSGTITDHGLAVTDLHGFKFQQMTEAKSHQFWADIGYPGL